MKFQRNLKIFRGQMDAAPLAGVFFLLLFFILFQSSLVFVPGFSIELSEEKDLTAGGPRRLVVIDEKEQFKYEGQTWKPEAFYERLTNELRRAKGPRSLVVRNARQVPPQTLNRLRSVAADLGIAVEKSFSGVELPEAGDLPGLMGPHVVLAVRPNRQYFFQNQFVPQEQIKAKLEAASRQSSELTLVLHIDRDVTYEALTEINQLARSAGFRWVWQATRPQVLPVSTNPPARL